MTNDAAMYVVVVAVVLFVAGVALARGGSRSGRPRSRTGGRWPG